MAASASVPFSAIAKEVIVIAVMGTTGSGKSTFIQKLTGSDDAVVGNDLASCTQKPKLIEFRYNGLRIIMIDTPGFDDTYRTDADVLQDVATCLNMTYNANMKLTGLIYLHRITDPRMTHGGMRNLGMFRKLCGVDPMKNVILATTFWGQVDTATADKREDELMTNPDYWSEMIDEGAEIARFKDTQESALEIVKGLLYKNKVSLDIQKQMCDEGLPLAQTHAGVALNAELEEMAKRHEEEIVKMKQEIEDARRASDLKMETTLRRQSTKYEKKLNEIHAQQEVLNETRRNEIRAMEQELDRRLRRMELEKKEEADTRLKKTLSKARKEDKKEEAKKAEAAKKAKRAKVVQYVKVAAAITTATVTVAGCFVNPMMAGHAVTSFVGLANSFFEGSGSAEDGDGDANGGNGDGVDGEGDDVDGDIDGNTVVDYDV